MAQRARAPDTSAASPGRLPVVGRRGSGAAEVATAYALAVLCGAAFASTVLFRRRPAQRRGVMFDVTEQRQADAARAQLAAIFESSQDAIIRKTLDGIITHWNAAAERLYGYSSDEVVGQSIALLVPPGRPDEIPGILERLSRGERIEHYETERVRKDGRRIHVSVTISPIREASGVISGASTIARDITDRKWSEAVLAGERDVLELLARGTPLDDVLEKLARNIEDLAGDGLRASVLLLDADGLHLRHAAAPSLPEGYRRAIDGLAIGPNAGSCGTAAYRREPVIVTDIASDPLWADYRDLALGFGLRACWSIPILGASGRTLGTFALYYDQPRAPSQEHLKLIDLVGRVAAMVVERSQADHERAALLTELQATEARYRNLFEGTADAVLVIDADGCYVDANAAAARLTGYTRDELRQLSVGALSPAPEQTQERWRDIQEQGSWHGETELRRRDGSIVPVETTLSSTSTPNGVLHISAMRDISARRELADLQRDFVAMVTHELRNPLAGLKGFAQLMQRRQAYSEQAVNTILAQADQLDRLLGDLLDGAQLEVGRMELRRSTVDLLDLTQTYVEEAQAGTTAHRIRIDTPDSVPAGQWDHDRLAQVFRNLLSNAVKYSPGGEILVTVRNLGAEAEVSVQDGGRGISADALPHIFDRFYRSKAADATSGLGLGLHITRALVEAHGGRIRADSKPGQGSRFTFTLPYREPESARVEAPADEALETARD